ncbi:MAG TPA: M20/M25/M40 family metallo-hydrolase, partial [Candidatus Limnocylindrales bacterium]|nr:M20/M25/M40 family metallo-hydrolase [Candidatus Limnocylindrales bacterium]
MDAAALKTRVNDRIDARKETLDAISLEIHAKPELAFEERTAARLLCGALESEGVTVTRGAVGLETAFVAEFGKGRPAVAILGEYDALPGVGHACGHNLMGTAAIGAYLALRDLASELPGRVIVMGCPAEERGNGKNFFIQSGAFAGVDAALMYHPGDRDELDPLMLALVALDVEFIGKAAHAAAEPHEGVNALDALML